MRPRLFGRPTAIWSGGRLLSDLNNNRAFLASSKPNSSYGGGVAHYGFATKDDVVQNFRVFGQWDSPEISGNAADRDMPGSPGRGLACPRAQTSFANARLPN